MKKTLILTIALAVLFAGVAVAQDASDYDLPDAGILPGSPAYFIKSIGETLGGLFAWSAEAKADRALNLAEKRLAEAEALADKGDLEKANEAADRYKAQLEKAQKRAERVGEDALSRVAEKALNHQSVLADVYDRVPEQAKSAIEHAIEMSMGGQDMAMTTLSDETREDVEERLQGVQSRVSEKLNELRSQGVDIPASAGPPFDGSLPVNVPAPDIPDGPDVPPTN